MKTGIVVCLLVGITFATNLKSENSEYQYDVDGRTFTGLHEVANQFSGILYAAKLKIQPKSQEKWMAQVSDVKIAKVHSLLPKGWTSYIPESELNWQPVKTTSKSFEVVLKSGVITDLIVSKDIKNWEANMMKGIMSQFQLDIKASEYMSAQINAFDEDQSRPSAVFETMEETVTGKTETLYEVHPVSEYTVNSVYPYLNLQEGQNVFEVIKHKNYTNNQELPVYSFGFGDAGQWDPATNQMGRFFTRSTFSHALLTGDADRHVIQNSSTVNKIIVNPTLMDQQKGMVVSSVRVSLNTISSQWEPIEEVRQPQRLGNLVYTYDAPNSGSADVREKKQNENKSKFAIDLDSERLQLDNMMNRGMQRSFGQKFVTDRPWTQEHYTNEQPKINEAPGAPLLPFSVGCKGNPIKKCVDIMKVIPKLAIEIGSDLEDSSKISEYDTLNKFTILTSLMRTLSTDDLQKVASGLYTQATDGSKATAWQAFRDAVAECGTGPALVVIQTWIVSGKVKGNEAAMLVSTMSKSVRQPTLEYLKIYLELVQSPIVQSQWPLNDTTIITFGDILRKSVVDRKESMSEYPVNSFGKFSNEESRKFVTETAIPYFSKKLQEAISQEQTHMIHAYIRGIGNIAHPKCLEAFEPYWEGKKQASHFQRLLMIASLQKLTKTHPDIARSVFFKMYQNIGESDIMRIAAAYSVLRSNPPVDMMQLMASNTHSDPHVHVNAAVKSAIIQASEINQPAWEKLRTAALAAKPLLTKKIYGLQHGRIHALEYAYNTMNTMYKDDIRVIASEDHLLPSGLTFIHRENINGIGHRLLHLQATVSSIKELFHVGWEQTASYERVQKEQEEKASQQMQNPWSSQNIAKLLNMRADEMEQLEGHLYMEDGVPTTMFSFDNRTFEELPEYLSRIEDNLRNGKSYNYVKFTNNKERAISFPTEMGFPFLYTYDMPKLVKVRGSMKASSSPRVSENGKLHKPEKIEMSMDMTVGVHSKIQGRLSFYTPFDHKQYISGYDKLLHVEIPLNGDIEVDVKQTQMKAKLNIADTGKEASLVRYHTRPYTSLKDIMNFQPLSTHSHTQTIMRDNMRSFDRIFGKQYTGIACHVKMEHEREFIDTPLLLDLLKKGSLPNMFLSLWNVGYIQTSNLSIAIDHQQSSTRNIIVGLGYQKKYMAAPDSNDSIDYKHFSEADGAAARQSILIEKVSAGIKNVAARAMDAYVQFQGEKKIEYIATGAMGKSNVDPKSRWAVYYKKASDSQEVRPYGASLVSNNDIPNTNGLDLEYSLQTEPKIQSTWKLYFGESQDSLTKIEAVMHFKRSQERKEYLQRQPKYIECQREMREGNKQLQACVNMTMESNLLDDVLVSISHENLSENIQEKIRTVYDALRINYIWNMDDINELKSLEDKKILLRARFDNDLRSVNVSMMWQNVHSTMRNIPVSGWAKEVFVLHPVFHLKTRLSSWVMGLKTYRPFCSVDKSRTTTFNNRTYPAEISTKWTVMFHYVPKDARHGDRVKSVEDQLKSQIDNYVVMVRANSHNKQQKEVKLILSTPETEFNVVDITMTPRQSSQGSKVDVAVDSKNIVVTDKQSYDIKGDHIQIYALPNGEVKLEVRGEFYILYDGERVRLTIIGGHYTESVRGMCGSYSDESTQEFLTPQNCLVRDPMKFWKSYELEGQEGQEIRATFGHHNPECSEKRGLEYANVVSDLDVGRDEDSERSSVKCSHFQTRYLEENGHICFTTRAVSVCHRNCQPHGVLKKNVPVHCIPKTTVTRLWKTQIDGGLSPDFSQKKVTKTVTMELPRTCLK